MQLAAQFLTRRELTAFEQNYLYLVDCEWFHFSNLWHQDSRDFRVVTKDKARQLWREFAPRTRLSRKRIAHHESGHAVALAATFREMEEVVIDVKGDPGGAVGYVQATGKARDDNPDLFLAKQPLPPMPLVRISIIFCSGGFVAESFLNNATIRAYHELLLVYLQCRYLDDLDKAKPMTNFDHFTRLTKDAIASNKALFHRAITELLASSQLSNVAMQELHSSTKKIDSSLIFK